MHRPRPGRIKTLAPKQLFSKRVMHLPWAQRGLLQSFFRFSSTFKIFNNLGNLLFAQQQPE